VFELRTLYPLFCPSYVSAVEAPKVSQMSTSQRWRQYFCDSPTGYAVHFLLELSILSYSPMPITMCSFAGSFYDVPFPRYKAYNSPSRDPICRTFGQSIASSHRHDSVYIYRRFIATTDFLVFCCCVSLVCSVVLFCFLSTFVANRTAQYLIN